MNIKLLQSKLFHWPVVNSLGEPAQDRVPVGEVGLLLRYISLAIGQHVSEVLHKMVGLLLKDFLIKEAQMNQVACQMHDAVEKIKSPHYTQWNLQSKQKKIASTIVQSSYSFLTIYQVSRECGSPQDTHRCPNTALPGWETEWTSAAGRAFGWKPCTVERERILKSTLW